MSRPDSKSLSDRAGFLILANVIKFSIGILMPMILVRLLTKDDYGTYQQMILVGTTVSSLLVLGLPTSVFYFYKHVSPQQVPALVVQTTLMLIASGVVASLIIWAGAQPISTSMNNPGMAHLLVLVGISVGLGIAGEHCISFLITQNRYELAVFFEVGEALLRILIMLTPLWLGYGFPGLVVSLVVFAGVRLLVRNAFLFGWSRLDFKGWTHNTFVVEQLKYSIPVAIVPLVAMIGNTFNRGTLAASFSPAQYAIFAVGSLMPPLSTVFQAAVSNVLRAELPPLVRDGNLTEVSRIIREAVRKLSIILLPSFVFLFAHAKDFITALFTASYADSVNVFRLFVWELPLDMLVLSAIPQVFGKTKLNMYINFWATGALLIASYVLIKTVGFYGAAIAHVFAQYFTAGLFLVAVLRLTRASLAQLLPFPHIARVIGLSLVAAVASRAFPALSSIALVNLAVDALVYSAVFLLGAIPCGILTQDDRRLIRRWVFKFLPAGAAP